MRPVRHPQFAIRGGLLAAALLSLSSSAFAAGEAREAPAEEAKPFQILPAPGNYNVTWQADRRFKDVRGVFPHPFLPPRAALATAAGLWLTDDGGAQWKFLPETSPQKVGPLNGVTFSPIAPDTFYLASAEKGVWATEDGGARFTRIGAVERGMASNSVLSVIVYPFDTRFHSLLALHGEAAPGISRTQNHGERWDVVARSLHVQAALFHNASRDLVVYLAGARKDRPDVPGLWMSMGLGETWLETVSDTLSSDGVLSLHQEGVTYWATSYSGLCKVGKSGSYNLRVGPLDYGRWANIGVTCGPYVNKEVLYAYEPSKLGLVLSEDGFQTGSLHSQGLCTGAFVKDGAHVRANANGTAYYAAVNGTLYLGRVSGSKYLIRSVALDPPAVICDHVRGSQAVSDLYTAIREFPRTRQVGPAARRLNEQIRVARSHGLFLDLRLTADVQGKPETVSVNLARLRRPAKVLLYDDGTHGDAKPQDGVYTATIHVSFRDLDVQGVIPIPVTASGKEDDDTCTRSALLTFYRRKECFVFWNEWGGEVVDKIGSASIRVDNTPKLAKEGSNCLKITTGTEPWRLAWGGSYHRADLTGYHALSFWIKSDGKETPELQVALRSNPDDAFPAYSETVDVVKGNFIEGGAVAGEWRFVAIPLERFYRPEAPFQFSLLGSVAFGGPASGESRTLWVDDIRFWADAAELNEARGGIKK